jgi:hypothetical protein
MRKSTYTINGCEVSGYRCGEFLAIRDKMTEYEGPRDRKKCAELGRWILEHLPTGSILCRAHYRAELVLLEKQRPRLEFEELYLGVADVSETVASLKRQYPDWLRAIMAHRDRMNDRQDYRDRDWEESAWLRHFLAAVFVAGQAATGRAQATDKERGLWVDRVRCMLEQEPPPEWYSSQHRYAPTRSLLKSLRTRRL